MSAVTVSAIALTVAVTLSAISLVVMTTPVSTVTVTSSVVGVCWGGGVGWVGRRGGCSSDGAAADYDGIWIGVSGGIHIRHLDTHSHDWFGTSEVSKQIILVEYVSRGRAVLCGDGSSIRILIWVWSTILVDLIKRVKHFTHLWFQAGVGFSNPASGSILSDSECVILARCACWNSIGPSTFDRYGLMR